jgi:hypothetical protein
MTVVKSGIEIRSCTVQDLLSVRDEWIRNVGPGYSPQNRHPAAIFRDLGEPLREWTVTSFSTAIESLRRRSWAVYITNIVLSRRPREHRDAVNELCRSQA